MKKPFNIKRRNWLLSGLGLFTSGLIPKAFAQKYYRRIPLQYIACLASEGEKSGTGAENWGLWKIDPGPIGVWLRLYKILEKTPIAPAGWRFDIDDWWLDENGLIMKAPEFPMPAGQYYVTNGEDDMSLLTVEKPDAEGKQAWSLSDDKMIKNVTHGPCRSARYTPTTSTGTCSPKDADQKAFPLKPGEQPPEVTGCDRQQYAVLIVFGLPVEG